MRQNTNAAASETLQFVKDAIYDLQVGPAEITSPDGTPSAYVIKFEIQHGVFQEVFIPIPSTYQSICRSLKAAMFPAQRSAR
ncbi:hypothetical protein DLM45_12225 [Hyphomicrobium methylovorum]|uniref:hypothetical protein n=1 Tax=Hyphomicrobium methylovorum TaxID=84 RepID=UPI0015E77496|nr:hypothetical protein [Hyphomicrobium methylovorum]MBA2126981.1 hypothetical protein [Hyphomicrobium methylovorum]